MYLNNLTETSYDDINYQNDLKLANKISNKMKKNVNYNFRKIEEGTEVLIRKDGNKNTEGKKAIVIEDNGGATLLAKYVDSGQTFRHHKHMVWLYKGTKEYERLFKDS